jgi:hypothetical protein
MIYLKHDMVNKVPLTLNESLLASVTPNFLFEFIREWDKQVFTYSFSDVSDASYYFNLFEIELGATASLTQSGIDGVIKMAPGQYVYNIYDVITDVVILDGYIQSGYFNLIETNNLLETGMLVVEKKEVGNVIQNPQNIYY